MRTPVRHYSLGLAAAALLLSSTVSVAAAAPAPAPPQNSWAALSMLSPVGATAFGGAAVAAQPAPPPGYRDSLPPPPIPVLAVWLATLLLIIYIATKNDHHGAPVPNSPA